MGIAPTREQYESAFEKERLNEYPVITALEERLGYAVDRDRLEAAARVLACPVKKNPPNWQHGRVIYALARNLLQRKPARFIDTFLDIGTAKGFSAVCMVWAIMDHGDHRPWVLTVDIIDPHSREPRNSIADFTAKNGLASYVCDFLPPAASWELKMFIPDVIGGPAHQTYVENSWRCTNFAFVDGSHTYDGVRADIELIEPRQGPGDIMLFDDLQVAGVARAVSELEGYDIEYIDLLPKRKYAIAVRQ